MKQYKPKCEEGTLLLVADDEQVEIGAVDQIVDAIGGETFTLEYDEEQQTQPWLDLDENNALEIDVREAVTTMHHPEDLVSDVRKHDLSIDRYGIPERAMVFADKFVDILNEHGKQSH